VRGKRWSIEGFYNEERISGCYACKCKKWRYCCDSDYAEMVVILRPMDTDREKRFHRVIGLPYVYALMDGEIMGKLKGGKAETQDIRLC
jgi:hypothetical protein